MSLNPVISMLGRRLRLAAPWQRGRTRAALQFTPGGWFVRYNEQGSRRTPGAVTAAVNVSVVLCDASGAAGRQVGWRRMPDVRRRGG